MGSLSSERPEQEMEAYAERVQKGNLLLLNSTKKDESLVRDIIPFNPNTKLLGVTFNESLTFSKHGESVNRIAMNFLRDLFMGIF